MEVILLLLTAGVISFLTVKDISPSMVAQIDDGNAQVVVASAAATESTEPISHVSVETLNPQDVEILELANAAAAECAKSLEIAIDQGIKSEEEIFSTLYFPIVPITSPRTYSTFYDEYTDKVITPIEDTYLEKDPIIVFVVLVDKNGYLPSHNSKFSQPRTGNLELDLRTNRTKRIFNDITGFRAAKSQADFLLQVYRRDTGETMKDLSVPVYVRGKHWGALRIGYLGE